MGVVRPLRNALVTLGLVLGVLVGTAAAERNLVVVPTKAQPAVEPRIALVIGNGDYPAGAALVNPVNDARAVADRLSSLRFRVTRLENATQDQMYEAIRAFGDALRDGGVGLFYYAGHALQVRGRNYLLPVHARIEREDEIIYRTVDTGQILDKMESARNRVNIVILDACRSNPFGREYRTVAPGLAVVDAPYNTLIAFATAPGALASDGGGSHGLYTQHLLQALSEPGIGLEDLFKKVRSGVRRESAGRQVPWESTSLEVDFVFDPQSAPPAAPAPGPALAQAVITAPDPLAVEVIFWDSIKSSTDPDDYNAYLKRYPSGAFAVLAGNRLRALSAPAHAPATAAASSAPAPAIAVAQQRPPQTSPSQAPATASTKLAASQALASTPVAPAVTAAPPAPPGPPAGTLPAAVGATRPAPLRALIGHTGEVLAVAVSRSGSQALTGAEDRSLRLWDLTTGREVRRLGLAAVIVTATAISADGRLWLTGGDDRGVRLWDASSGTVIALLQGHAASVSAVLFGPTARYAVSAASDGEVIVWDLPSGSVIRRAAAGPGRLRSLALSRDGRYLLTAAEDARVRLWDVGNLAPVRSFGPMSASASAVAFSDVARRVVAVDARGALWSWQTASGALERRHDTPGPPPAQAAIDTDGTTALLAAASGEMILWDIATGHALWRGGAPSGRVTALGLAARATIGLAAGDDKRLLLWALER